MEEPEAAQVKTLHELLKGYAQTDYGIKHGADSIGSLDEYGERFPKLGYPELKGYLEPVKRGDHASFLPEPPETWVMTRGTTGTSKVLPATKTHLQQILGCGARALINYVDRRGDAPLGKMLNLSMPSRVATIRVQDGELQYGYSSGTYSRIFPSMGDSILVPGQAEIDSLETGMTRED